MSGTPYRLPVLSPRSQLLGPVHVEGRLRGADTGGGPLLLGPARLMGCGEGWVRGTPYSFTAPR